MPPGEYLCILYRVLAVSNPAEGTTSFEVSASYEIDSTACSLHDDSLAFGSLRRKHHDERWALVVHTIIGSTTPAALNLLRYYERVLLVLTISQSYRLFEIF